MKFAENLQYLRQDKGYTQEQLAEKLQVSRQSVSKWESGGSYPEMEKILQICDLFQCSMDVLMQGDIKLELISDEAGYDKHMNQRSIMTAVGAGIVIMSPAAYELTVGVSVAEHLANMIFMFVAVIGIIVLIVAGLQHEEFQRRNPKVGNIYNEKEINKFYKKHITFIAVGVGLILCGVILSSGAEGFALPKPFNEEFIYGIFLTLVSIAVMMLVYVGIQKEKYDIESYNGRKERKEDKKTGKICGVIMLVATAIFLLGGFLGNYWSVSWVAFPIGGIACAITSILIAKE